ncbi:MAG TPA: endolytic transglycosylase MltG [Candidatus Saccharimonadales bacterium]|nr:endolytic transglycosylase MltG [Candidatus Saccharimonadales bacterium]
MKVSRIVLLGLGVVGVIVLGVVIWYLIMTQPADSAGGDTVTFRVETGEGTPDIGDNLAEAGLIRSKTAFVWYVTLHGLRRDLQAGNYELSAADSVADIADALSHGKVSVNRLVVPEGYTLKQIAKLAEDKGISQQQFEAAVSGSYNNDFLAARPPEGQVTLEGYLFPDSYEVSKPVRPNVVVQQMLDNFAQKVQAAKLVPGFAARGLTLHQGVTLASIVEKEAGKETDRPMIASVFYNRLKAGMPLGSDVTILYAAEVKGVPFDIRLDSTYNTYTHRGLPPGPICNPGISSMKAVANPATTDYLYFLADKQGNVHYAKTAAEHEANVKKYLR